MAADEGNIGGGKKVRQFAYGIEQQDVFFKVSVRLDSTPSLKIERAAPQQLLHIVETFGMARRDHHRKRRKAGARERECLEQNLFLAAMGAAGDQQIPIRIARRAQGPQLLFGRAGGKLQATNYRDFFFIRAKPLEPRRVLGRLHAKKCETSKNPAEKGTPARISRKCLGRQPPAQEYRRNTAAKR